MDDVSGSGSSVASGVRGGLIWRFFVFYRGPEPTADPTPRREAARYTTDIFGARKKYILNFSSRGMDLKIYFQKGQNYFWLHFRNRQNLRIPKMWSEIFVAFIKVDLPAQIKVMYI